MNALFGLYLDDREDCNNRRRFEALLFLGLINGLHSFYVALFRAIVSPVQGLEEGTMADICMLVSGEAKRKRPHPSSI